MAKNTFIDINYKDLVENIKNEIKVIKKGGSTIERLFRGNVYYAVQYGKSEEDCLIIDGFAVETYMDELLNVLKEIKKKIIMISFWDGAFTETYITDYVIIEIDKKGERKFHYLNR